MAGKSVSFNTTCKLCKDYFDKLKEKQHINNAMSTKTTREITAALNLCDSQFDSLAKWLSCNGEVWGVGPTVLFASAAALFLYNELEATVFMPGDQVQVSVLEKTLISSMMLGMLALMIHLWVCSMRFFQYYLDTVIRDSPSMLLEMTTAGLLGGQSEIVPLGPLTRFLRQQQPQIHITVCWFLSLCYADYVRKHYCQRFNMPYLEQWQAELQERFVRGTHQVMEKVNSFVGLVHQRLRGYAQIDTQIREMNIEPIHINTVRCQIQRDPRLQVSKRALGCHVLTNESATPPQRAASPRKSTRLGLLGSQAIPQRSRSRDSDTFARWKGARPAVHRTPAAIKLGLQTMQGFEEYPWRMINRLPFD